MKVFASLTFDDGCQNYFTRFRPILNKYGFKASFYIITKQVGLVNRMTWKQIKILHQEGHEIGSHTHTHQRLIHLSDKELDFELRESKKKLTEFKATTLSYPFGDYDSRVVSFAKKYYSVARACGDLEGHEKDLGLNSRRLNPFALKTVKFSVPTDVKTFFKNNCWLIFVIHDPPKMSLDYLFWSLKNRKLTFQDFIYFFYNLGHHSNREESTTKKLAAICHFLKKNAVEVVTLREAIRIFC